MHYFMRNAIFLAEVESQTDTSETEEEIKGERMQSVTNTSFSNFGLFQKMRQKQEFIWAKTVCAVCHPRT